MTTQPGFIAVIDLGTSKITGVIGRKNENNIISVLACESLPADNSIRRGAIYNIDKTAAIVRNLVRMLENKLSIKIGRVYVSLGGQSVRTEVIREMKQLSSSGIVTESVIEQLCQVAGKYKPDLKRKYAIADVEYFLDDKPEKNPVGVACSTIEAEYQIVVGRPNLAANIEKAIVEKAHLQIVDYIVAPIATAQIVLTEEEKELGCALVDFGAGTSTLSIYKGGLLRRMVTVPFGGKNITKDIVAELNFVENEAEQYKIKFGKAKENAETNLFLSPFSAKPDIDLVELNRVILMRLDEITANIREQIRLSDYHEQLGAGLIITGGASQLKNLDSYLSQKLEMSVRKASSRKSLVNNTPEYANNPALTSVLGALLFADESCEEVAMDDFEGDDNGEESQSKGSFFSTRKIGALRDKIRKEQEKDRKREEKKKREEKSGSNTGTKIKNQIGNIFSGMFGEEDDDEQ